MTRLASFVLGLGLLGLVVAETREAGAAAPRVRVNTVNVAHGVTKVSGKLEDGAVIPLDWAQSSGVACFPGNHFDAFRGRHVLYRFDLPARSIAKVSLKGLGPGDVNLYAYRAAPGERMVPPQVTNTACEASYAVKRPGTTPNVGVVEKVELVAIQNPYTIYVGVAGYAGVESGGFELTIELKTDAAKVSGEVKSATPIAVKPGLTKVSGTLDGGVEVDLDWAQASNVACFPGNHFEAFKGRHVLYRFDLPAKSTAKVRLSGKGPGDVNLYAYRAAVGEVMLPPKVMGTSCEASYGRKTPGTTPNVGVVEEVEFVAIQNPFTIYVGVAGYAGVLSGGFELTVELQTEGPKVSGEVKSATPIAVKPGVTKVSGTLDGGVEVDLDWAQASNVACFPGNHFEAFKGRHVLYRFDLPAKSTAKVKLSGKGPGDVNLYAYRAAVGEVMLPPKVMGTSCEASYGRKTPGTTPNVGVVEEVEFVAIQNPFTIYVGVAGYAGVVSGGFELTVELQTEGPKVSGEVKSATPIAVKPGVTKVSGTLDGGVEVDLDWAQASNVACFPGNHFEAFKGRHVLYRFDLPAKSTAKVRLSGKGPGDVNLYAYRAAVGEVMLPPKVMGTSCEASYGRKTPGTTPNVGVVEEVEFVAIQNPFTIYVGVAGYAGVLSGGFELTVELETEGPKVSGEVKSATPIAVKPGVTKVSGTLDGGVEVDLDWAQASNVACFPGNHFEAFKGRHVLYRFDLPAKSTAKVKLSGKGPGDVNLYAYRAAVGEVMLPPKVMGTSCEASYGRKTPGTTPNVGVVEEVEFVAIQNPFTIYVGVAGYAGVVSGGFELTVELETAAPEKTGKVVSAVPVAVEVGATAVIEGRLDGGVEIPLGWAETSNVACFGAHRFKHFEGRHVVYRLDQPAYSTLSVKVTPKAPGLDVSLYVYRVAANDTTSLPPDVHSARCEASYGKRDLEVSPNPGEVESVSNLITVGNPFGVFIGVAGANGVLAGEYTLEVKLEKR